MKIPRPHKMGSGMKIQTFSCQQKTGENQTDWLYLVERKWLAMIKFFLFLTYSDPPEVCLICCHCYSLTEFIFCFSFTFFILSSDKKQCVFQYRQLSRCFHQYLFLHHNWKWTKPTLIKFSLLKIWTFTLFQPLAFFLISKTFQD